MLKKLRFYARFIVVCLLLRRRQLVDELLRVCTTLQPTVLSSAPGVSVQMCREVLFCTLLSCTVL